mmetsp:Transcript_58344/g.66563  ORF Transcript_58344/g.66563 Transcript_58344/m.66563 type:complete len:367 (+) Transcript_58344:49-1149(+)
MMLKLPTPTADEIRKRNQSNQRKLLTGYKNLTNELTERRKARANSEHQQRMLSNDVRNLQKLNQYSNSVFLTGPSVRIVSTGKVSDENTCNHDHSMDSISRRGKSPIPLITGEDKLYTEDKPVSAHSSHSSWKFQGHGFKKNIRHEDGGNIIYIDQTDPLVSTVKLSDRTLGSGQKHTPKTGNRNLASGWQSAREAEISDSRAVISREIDRTASRSGRTPSRIGDRYVEIPTRDVRSMSSTSYMSRVSTSTTSRNLATPSDFDAGFVTMKPKKHTLNAGQAISKLKDISFSTSQEAYTERLKDRSKNGLTPFRSSNHYEYYPKAEISLLLNEERHARRHQAFWNHKEVLLKEQSILRNYNLNRRKK